MTTYSGPFVGINMVPVVGPVIGPIMSLIIEPIMGPVSHVLRGGSCL